MLDAFGAVGLLVHTCLSDIRASRNVTATIADSLAKELRWLTSTNAPGHDVDKLIALTENADFVPFAAQLAKYAVTYPSVQTDVGLVGPERRRAP